MKVGIIGANGYTGFELMKLLSRHSKVSQLICGSRSNKDTVIADMYPSLLPVMGKQKYCDNDIAAFGGCEVVFTALPHGLSADFAGKLVDKGIRVIDLSADYRYTNIGKYESVYNVVHPRKDLLKKAVYGLCELNAREIKTAQLIGNPGCYTTCSILPLYPLLEDKLISPSRIVIDAKSGVSGAGRKSETNFSFCELEGNFSAYAVTTHRHTSEIEEKISVHEPIALSFTPHLLPIKRGILSTIYADLMPKTSHEQIASSLTKRYKSTPFVRVVDSLPDIKSVAGSNMCYIGYKIDSRLNRIIIVSVLDNLLKGASGQAVQNMNIMFGLDEACGLNKISNGL